MLPALCTSLSGSCHGFNLTWVCGFFLFFKIIIWYQDYWLPQWLSGKESACNAGNVGLIPGSGRSHEGGHGNSLQYSCLENLTDRGAWWATIHGAAKELDVT